MKLWDMNNYMSTYTWLYLQLYELVILFILGYSYEYMSTYKYFIIRIKISVFILC